VLLHWLANADVAVWCVLFGVLLIYAEFNRPGTVLLGAAGALLVMLGCYGLSRLPVQGLGVVVLAAGMLCLGAEIWLRSRGVAGTIGTLAILFGLEQLIRAPGVHLVTAVLGGGLFAGVTLWLGSVAMRARRAKQVPGLPW